MVFADQIRELLYTEELVIIPGLGGFISQYNPAEINDETQISPPSKEIRFNSEMLDDNGILKNHLVSFLNKPPDEVQALISSEVEKLHDSLASGQTFVLNGIGDLSKNKDDQIVFRADIGTNFNLNSFGLGSFSFPVLEAEKPKPFSNPIIFRQPSTTKVRENLPGTKAKKSKDTYATALIGIAVFTFIVISLVPYNARITDAIFRHPASLGPLPSLVKLEPSVDEINQLVNEPMVQPAEALQNNQSQTVEMNYPIVAGSFVSQVNADKLNLELESMGYSSRVEKTKNFYRVILKDYATLSEAEIELPELQAKHPSLQLWVNK